MVVSFGMSLVYYSCFARYVLVLVVCFACFSLLGACLLVGWCGWFDSVATLWTARWLV